MPGNSGHSTWHPILDGPVADRADEAIHAIADGIQAFPPLRLQRGQVNEQAFGASLAGGRAGLAVLYAYLARAWSDDEAGQIASRLLDEAVDSVAEVGMEASLYAGFVGIAWALTHLSSDTDESDADDPNEGIDEALADYLTQSPWQRDYDLIRGLVGLGVYALDRLSRPGARGCLERVIDRLDEMAERAPEGVTWLTRPELLPPQQRQACPHGYYNLGTAHGVPGVIGMLGRACAVDVSYAKSRPLLDGAVTWLLAQRLPGSPGASFPAWVGPDVDPAATRSAWCYGDPGVAATLLHAARCVGESAWEEEAVAIARAATERPVEQAGVVDAGLCHGAVSLGHIYNRMFQATGEAFLQQAARFWFERALEMRRPDRGIAGYSTWMPDEAGRQTWVNDPGIWSGAAGVALALLAATTSIEPAWDRMLLVSIPPSAS